MSVARALIPNGIRVLLDGRHREEIDQTYRLAEQHSMAALHSHRRRAENAAQEIQWLQAEADAHVRTCSCSDRGRAECPELKRLKKDMGLTRRRYVRALKRLGRRA